MIWWIGLHLICILILIWRFSFILKTPNLPPAFPTGVMHHDWNRNVFHFMMWFVMMMASTTAAFVSSPTAGRQNNVVRSAFFPFFSSTVWLHNGIGWSMTTAAVVDHNHAISLFRAAVHWPLEHCQKNEHSQSKHVQRRWSFKQFERHLSFHFACKGRRAQMKKVIKFELSRSCTWNDKKLMVFAGTDGNRNWKSDTKIKVCFDVYDAQAQSQMSGLGCSNLLFIRTMIVFLKLFVLWQQNKHHYHLFLFCLWWCGWKVTLTAFQNESEAIGIIW